MESITRRGFVVAASAATLSAGAAAALAAPAPEKAGETEWDETVDVVVAGSGMSLFAAMYGHMQGANVLVLEKNGFLGGCASVSGGAVYLPMNDAAVAQGENREDAIKTLTTLAEGASTADLIESYVDGSTDFCRWSADELGFPWDWGNQVRGWDEYQTVDSWQPGRSFGIKAQYVDAAAGDGYGMAMFKWLIAKVDELGVPYRLNTAVTNLVLDDDGSVAGVVAEGPEGTVRIRAEKGVLLATGGFDHDADMRKQFLRTPVFNTCCFPSNTGDGIKMGWAAGADLAQMQSVWGCPCWLPVGETVTLEEPIHNSSAIMDNIVQRGLPGGLIVNRYGIRFGDESANYHTFNRTFAAWDAGADHNCMTYPGYLIVDKNFTDNFPLPGDSFEIGRLPEGAVQADTLEELCELCGIDWDGFSWQLDQFNSFAEAGYDPQFHRGESVFDVEAPVNLFGWGLGMGMDGMGEGIAPMAPVKEPPFTAMAVYPGMLGTKGGLKTNGKAQVISREGTPIRGLYASGGGANTPFGEGYPAAGAVLGTGAVMGFLGMRNLLLGDDAYDVVEAQAAEAQPTGQSAPASYRDGSYEASYEGIHGPVPVTVTVRGGAIVSVEVGDNSETSGIGSVAIDQLPGRIVAANGVTGVDGVAGASLTSSAILNGVTDCLTQAAL